MAKVLACQREEEAKAAHARELEHIQAAEVGANRAKLSAPGVGCMHGEAHVRAVKYISIKYMPGQWCTCKGGAVAHSYSLHPKHVRVVL